MNALSLTVDNRVVLLKRVRIDQRSDRLDIAVDGALHWTSNVASWRASSVGFGPSGLLVWTARQVLLLGRLERPPVVVEIPDDVLWAFELEERLVVVCETSVRLFDTATSDSLQTLALPDVITDAVWRGVVLELRSGDESFRFSLKANDVFSPAPAERTE